MYSLGIVQWNSTRRDHPGIPGSVSGSSPVIKIENSWSCFKDYMLLYGQMNNLDMIGYSNSYFVDCVDSHKSTSRYC